MNEEFKPMAIDETMRADLLSSAKWAKFLLVLSAIGVVFLFVAGIVLIVMGGKFGGACEPNVHVGPNPPCPFAGGLGLVTGIIYLVLAVILLYPLAKGFQFANGVKAACKTGSETELARGFAGMRSYLKFNGILAIIALVLYALIAILGLIGFCAMHGSCPA